MSILATPEANAARCTLDAIVFDMDGVLIDISRSIRQVNVLAPAFYLRTVLGIPAPDDLLTSAVIERYKHAGGFNDDWDLTYAIVLALLTAWRKSRDARMSRAQHESLSDEIASRGGGIDAAEAALLPAWHNDPRLARLYNKDVIRQVFEELFAGERCERLYHHRCAYYHGPGLIEQDRVLLDRAKIPAMKLGLLTGRTYEEAQAGRQLCGLQDILPDRVCITKRDGFHKPDPGGLEALARRLEVRQGGVYIGDTLDDLRTVRRLNELAVAPPFLIALVLSGPEGARSEPIFREHAPDVIGADVNEVLEWLTESA